MAADFGECSQEHAFYANGPTSATSLGYQTNCGLPVMIAPAESLNGAVEVVAGYVGKERLITEDGVANSGCVKERLKTDGSVRNAGCSRAPAKRRTGQMMIIKSSMALISIFAVFGVIPGRADDVLPPRLNFDRYSAMVKNSPFAIATAVALPAATPNFAKDLYVANAAHSPEGDMATIASSSDRNFKKYLTAREPVDGYGIARIEWSDRVGATKVTISKDGKFATLTFNQALLTQAPSKAPPTPGQPRQAVPLVGASMPPPGRTRGVIERNPKAVALPTPSLSLPTPNLEPLQAIDQRQQEEQQRREQEVEQQAEREDAIRKADSQDK